MYGALDDTIAALASPPAGAVRGVIRVSGPATVSCLTRCVRLAGTRRLDAYRRPTRLDGDLLIAAPLDMLPCQIYLWPTCRSYTRQPAAELHTVGALPLLEAALAALCQAGARLALPGEFTLRAFLAGRLDLTQAEAVLGVIEAETEGQLQAALSQLAGGLGTPLRQLRGELLDLLAQVEAGLDFVEEDIEFITAAALEDELRRAANAVDVLLKQLTTRADARSPLRVVLRGAPNAGKSSLLNALVGADAALVSTQPGTTRDYVARPFRWHGVEGTLIDTAGLITHAEPDALADAAQQVTRAQLQEATLELLCLDASQPLDAAHPARRAAPATGPRLVVWTKADVATPGESTLPGAVVTSSRTGQGIAALRRRIADLLADRPVREGAVVASTAARCHACLDAALQHLGRARAITAAGGGEELVAAELRAALDQLGQVVGAVYTDDLLDRIFSRFCIGK
jgi:tRNA modification GTPase